MPSQFAPDLIAAAQAANAKWRIPASVTLAQFGLESGWGKHMPADSNNPFGIKAVPGQPSVLARTQEFVGGRYVTLQAPFRKFASLAEAFDAHAQLLATSVHYATARTKLPDARAFAEALTGVYATAPHYGDGLVDLMQQDGLLQFDQPA